MPMRVDHDRRRGELAEAVWRLVLRAGVPAASVRAVANEAGLSMGSVRYFFHTQEELLQFAMGEVVNRARARVTAKADRREAAVRGGRPLDGFAALLEEVLPLDDERCVEGRIWAAFSAAASTDPEMQRLRREADEAVRGLCRTALQGMAELGLLEPDHDPADLALETQRLWALLDGLTVHLLAEPAYIGPRQARRVLRLHLSALGPPA
jgi:AcrR family transcriptional regulator